MFAAANATPADPCSAITCPPGKRCVLRASTSPSTHGVSVESPIAACVCYNVCPDEKDFGERCGSDNRTYGSECLLRNIACFMGSKLTVAYAGICNAGEAIYLIIRDFRNSNLFSYRGQKSLLVQRIFGRVRSGDGNVHRLSSQHGRSPLRQVRQRLLRHATQWQTVELSPVSLSGPAWFAE